MATETVFERVRRVVVEQFKKDVSEVTPESSFVDDLGADSLDLVEVMMSLEDEFSKDGKPVAIPDEDAENITTVQDAVNYIKENGIAQDDDERSS